MKAPLQPPPGRPRVNFECVIEGCERKAHCRQMCKLHYERWRIHGDPEYVARPKRYEPQESCAVLHCSDAPYGHGFCRLHWARWRRHPEDTRAEREIPLEERFWEKVQKTDSCWNWTGSRNPDGYGCFGVSGRRRLAHRVVLDIAGPGLVEGLVVDHVCHNRACVNPAHLEQVTIQENSRRRAWNRKVSVGA